MSLHAHNRDKSDRVGERWIEDLTFREHGDHRRETETCKPRENAAIHGGGGGSGRDGEKRIGEVG